VPVHEPTGLGLDLSGLDRGTVAHEMTIELLRASLSPVPLEALSRPRVDAAWRHLHDLATLFVAEVKSLTGARQEQQIRLGIGQVLDYAHAVRTDPPVGISAPKPVLVLEREPDDPRWSDLCESLGILLTWAPEFPGVR
jgi:hypothetical protein